MERTYIAHANVLNQSRIDVCLVQSFLQQSVDHIVEVGIFEATLDGLGQRCSMSKSDNHIVWVLLRAILLSTDYASN